MLKALATIFILFKVSAVLAASYEGEKGHYHAQRLRDLAIVSETRNPVERVKLLTNNYLKVTSYSHNIGLEILDQLERKIYPNGQQLNLINESLKSGLNLAKEINRLNSNTVELKLHQLNLRILVAENSKSLYGLYFGQKFLRDLVKDQMRWKQYGISDFEKEVLSNLTTQNIQVIESDIKKFLKDFDSYLNDPKTKKLAQEMSQLASVGTVASGQGLRYLSDTNIRWSAVLDTVGMSVGKVAIWASKGFGSIAGNITWREGYFHNDKRALDHMKKNLRPLDLIFEKRGYVLTDKTIPGNWGHVGVWLGNKEQLIEMGLWDRVEFRPFRERIEKGEDIYEVRRWGLVFNNLTEWMNLDESAIVRVNRIEDKTTDEILEIYKGLYAQWGKKYDFGFDAMTTNEITCTEIISLSYGNINWPMDKLAGRQTISPTNVAELVFYKDSPLEFITYIQGDKQGRMKILSESDFAEVINYEKRNKIFQKRFRECHNEQYRINRSTGIRFRNVCKTTYQEMVYEDLDVIDSILR